VRAPPVEIGRLLDESLLTGYQQRLVLLTALTIIFDGADNQLLGIALPAIMREWGLARSAFATALATGLFGMMLGGLAAGLLGDRFGRKSALLWSVFVFGAATSAVSLVEGLTALAVLRFVAGLGLGGALPNATALASEYVPRDRRALAVTLTIVCVPLGGSLAGLLAVNLLPVAGWRGLFAVGGALPVAVALTLIGTLEESPRYLTRHPARWAALARTLRRMGHEVPHDAAFVDLADTSHSRGSLAALLTRDFRRDSVALWAAFFSCLLAVYLAFNWVPSMIGGAGLGAAVGSYGITAFNLGGVAGAIAGALAFSRFGSKPTLLAMAAGGAAGALVLGSMRIAADSAAMPIILMLGVTGGLINAVQTTMYALAAHVYPTPVRATGVGTAIAIGRSGAIVSTYAGAGALDAGGSRLFFLMMAAAMLVSLVSLASVRRHIPRT
jgi:AAHS family 4-hydroxybenzoate transporter-like MFS transporter